MADERREAQGAGSAVPDQVEVPWGIALSVAWSSLRRRFLRSMVTMLGVVLAIAFLTYMRIMNDINVALVALDDDLVNTLLQAAGVDILAGGGTDSMMVMLLGLSLLTCLVGIINAMLMAVTERIKEIGTLKCLGAMDSFIVKSYFIESSLQGIIGTMIGLTIGLLVSLVIAGRYYPGYVLSNLPGEKVLISLAWSLGIGSVLSIVASILPAYWAARKTPVDAMRVEE